MVTQGLLGISATTYVANKVSNDELFQRTVVSMIGYDSSLDDITIQLVTDSTQSRSLSSLSSPVGVETKLMYSIATPTHIFNDTIQATAMFIQVLNESISTGSFDTLLHVNAGSTDWQSVTTAYVVFSTASPTSSPTSTPTSSPTKKDIIAASILAIPLDDKVAKAKIDYYLGAFMGYFLSIYICLYMYSFLRYGKTTATKLYDVAYQSESYIRNSTTIGSNNNEPILLDLYRNNAGIRSTMKLEDELKKVKGTTNKNTTDITRVMGDEGKYSKGYREYVHQQRTLLGCSPFLYPGGYAVKIPCTSIEIRLPPGRVEDILLFICHNHPLFSCFYFMDGSKLGAHGTRILYISKDVVVFVLYQFSNMLLQYFMLDGRGLGTFINLFVITPSAVSVGLLLKYLYTCPFTETVEFQRKYAKYELLVLFIGRLAIIPIMLVMCGCLIIACLFSSGRRVPRIIINYFLFVQFYGVLFALVKASLLFIDNYYYQLSVFGVVDLLCIGRLYKERILVEQLVVDVNYAYRINHYLFGLIKVQKILNRDDAIKAKWLTEGGGEEGYAIEMKKAEEDIFAAQTNPLQTELSIRDSAGFSMDGIFSAGIRDEEVCEYDKYNASNTGKIHGILTPTANHMHSSAPEEITDWRYASTNSNPNKVVKDHTVVAEDDAALYLEYHTLQSTHFDALYDIGAEDNEVVMSFEEWKTRRKQFKQGTDYSPL